MKIHVLSDNSGYIFIDNLGTSSSPYICKYLFNQNSIEIWQEINLISLYTYGLLMLDDSHLYFIGVDPTSSNMGFYKITFGNTNWDWANVMACSSGTWTTNSSETVILNSKIYSFFLYGTSQNLLLYAVTFNITDGSVLGSRFKSTNAWNYLWGTWIKSLFFVNWIEKI